jgi:hypothetical protein
MEYCIDAIHNDVVDVWNLRDHEKVFFLLFCYICSLTVMASICQAESSNPKCLTLSKTYLGHLADLRGEDSPTA